MLLTTCEIWSTPSTIRLARAKPDIGVIVNVWSAPSATETSPDGSIVPNPVTEAVIVNEALAMLMLSIAAGVIFCTEPSFFQKNTRL